MKKIFLVASVLGLFTAGINAFPGGKNPKKGSVAKAIVSTTAVSDTTHPKKKMMGKKKHHKMAKPAPAKTK